MTADARQFISKGNIHSTERILHNLSHLCCTNIRHNDFALTKSSIIRLDLLTYRLVISTDSTIIMIQLIDHIAWDDTFWSMHQIDILTNLKAILLNHWANKLVYRAWANGTLDNYSCPLRAHFHYFLHSCYHITGIHFF